MLYYEIQCSNEEEWCRSMYTDIEWTLRHFNKAEEHAWFQLCFPANDKTTYFKLYLYINKLTMIWKYTQGDRLVGTFTWLDF